MITGDSIECVNKIKLNKIKRSLEGCLQRKVQ